MAATADIWKSFVEVFGTWSPMEEHKSSRTYVLPDFEYWPQKGIKYLTRLYKDEVFHSFANLPQAALF